jgi:thiosulfate/3-mercaptopyruvate sulfurtransferase
LRIQISASDVLQNFDRYTIIDLRSKGEYGAGHIAGAISLPAGDLPFKTGAELISGADWAALLGSRGVGNGAKILAYDDGASGRGVARFWYVAKHYGHEDVLILNGGFAAAAGILPVTARVPEVAPVAYTTKVTPGYLIGLKDILANYEKITFLDVRSPEEFVGDNLRGNPRGGHIRGAILAVMDHFFADAPGQSFASPHKLAHTINNLGAGKKDLIVAY